MLELTLLDPLDERVGPPEVLNLVFVSGVPLADDEHGPELGVGREDRLCLVILCGLLPVSKAPQLHLGGGVDAHPSLQSQELV